MGRVASCTALFLGLSLMFGCDKSKTEGVPLSVASEVAMPPNHPPVGGHAKTGEVVEGTIVETMDAGGYTYVHLDTASGKAWAAVPKTTVAVGDKVAIDQAMPMVNFESPSLGRKFEKIYFGVLRGAGASPHGMAEGMMNPHGLAAGSAAPGTSALPIPAEIKVAKADGPSGHTVAEVFGKSKDLVGKEVRVRGMVVKVNKRIMGKNWIHLRDGSGSEEKKDHDLVITSEELPQVGATVLMTGKVVTDKDFGSGYSYAVLVEEATFTAEGGK